MNWLKSVFVNLWGKLFGRDQSPAPSPTPTPENKTDGAA